MKTLIKHTSHVAQVKSENLTQVQTICELLQWSEQQYYEFQFEQYIAFIDRMFFDYPDVLANSVKHSATFRGFWNNQVAIRNKVDFLPFATAETEDLFEVNADGELTKYAALALGDSYLVDEFMLVHNPKRLMHDDDFMRQYNYALKLISYE
jgi:hypothetical protein